MLPFPPRSDLTPAAPHPARAGRALATTSRSAAAARCSTWPRRYPELEVVWVVLSATTPSGRGGTRERGGVSRRCRIPPCDRRGLPRQVLRPRRRRDAGALRMARRPQINPDIILTHRRGDSHQDHRFVCELTWNTFRDNLILEYEIPKYDGDLSSPNLFVPISQELRRAEGRDDPPLLRDPAGTPLVHRGPVHGDDAAARDGGELTDAARGGVHLPEARARHGALRHGALARPRARTAPTPIGRRRPYAGAVRLTQIGLAALQTSGAHSASHTMSFGIPDPFVTSPQ